MIRELAVWARPELSLALLERAWHWSDAAQLSIWDSLIVAAADECGAKWILSEDFQAGMRFGDVMIVDPFRQAPSEFGLEVPV